MLTEADIGVITAKDRSTQSMVDASKVSSSFCSLIKQRVAVGEQTQHDYSFRFGSSSTCALTFW